MYKDCEINTYSYSLIQIDIFLKVITLMIKYVLRASHTAKTHQSRTKHAHIFVSARSVRRIRYSPVDRTWTVIVCKWMCVKGGLCVILSFERLKPFQRTTVRRCALFISRRAQFMRRVRVTMRGTRVKCFYIWYITSSRGRLYLLLVKSCK